MLSWSIFITTIPEEDAGYNEISKLYSLRWRIEIIFKSWKSNMCFSKIHNVSNLQLQVILLARFIMISVCTQYLFPACRVSIKQLFNKDLSLLKTIRYLAKFPEKILMLLNELNEKPTKTSDSILSLSRYCVYEKRKGRLNYGQCMEQIFGLS